MMAMLGRLLSIAFLLALFGTGAVHAADSALAEPRFESVGLGTIPQGVVSAVAQDRAGFIWIGTGAGLMRYDGYTFRLQQRDGKVAAMQSLGFIRTLLPGNDGRLWIGTESDGLASYDPASEKVQLYRSDDAKDGKGGPAPTIRALVEDIDGALWVGSAGGGLDRFDTKTGQFTRYRHSEASGSLPDNRVQSLLVDKQGTLWIGGWAGLSRRLRGSDRFEPVFSQPGTPGLAGKIVLRLFEASDGRIWVGTQQGDLALIDPKTGAGQLLDQAVGSGTASHGSVFSFAEVPGGPLWVGRAAGIELRAPADGQLLRHLHHDPRRPAGLAGSEVRTLMRDRAGWIWAGGYGVGLQRHNPGNTSIWVRGAELTPGSPLAEANVRSVLQLDNGEIWLGSNVAGVAVLDSDLRVIDGFRPQVAGRGSSAISRVAAMAQTRDGAVWVGADSGLYEFNRQHQQQRILPISAGLTRRLLGSSDGSLWVGTQDGLYLLRPGAAVLQRVGLQGGGVLGSDINAIAEAADRSLWVGTEKGLFRIEPGAAELHQVAVRSGAGLSNPSIVGLLIDSKQQLWVDTAVAGLHRLASWDGREAAFERISERYGFVGRPFGANLLEDARGRIWSQQFVYDPAGDRYDELTPADGVDFGTGWFRSYAKTADGRLLFGGSKGLLVVSADRFDRWSYEPPLVVSSLRIDGQPQPAAQLLRGLVMTPEHRSFSIEFAALDYSDPGRSRYAYRLDGFDRGWTEVPADLRIASYGNLSPGSYTLQVRGSNRSGLWSPHELSLTVKVLPAWWQTWWFRALCVLLLFAAMWGVVLLRTAFLRARQRVLQRLVGERTAALEALSLSLQQKSAELEESSLTDPLTGLRNRRFLTQHIEADVALTLRHYEDALQHGAPAPHDADLIFFLVDVDHFKSVNDEHGHAGGDAVLVQMRSRLQPVFREADYLMRWGGEEFLIVARGTSRLHAAELAERARAMVADQPFLLDDGTPVRRTCSVGFACYPLATAQPRAFDWATAVGVADTALYAAKRAGRNGWLGVLGLRPEADLAALQGQLPRAPDAWLAPRSEGPLDVVRSNTRY